MIPSTNAISPTESKWIADQIFIASDFVQKYANGQSLSLQNLELAWDNWIVSNPTDIQEANHVINAVGCAFGQALVDSTSFEWVIAEDSNGTDLAILAEPGRGDFLVFPASTISKRWVARESGFLCALANAFATKVSETHTPVANAKPWWRFWS